MFPTWRRTALHYRKPEGILSSYSIRIANLPWLIVGPMRMPFDSLMVMKDYGKEAEFSLLIVSIFLGNIFVSKNDLIDCGIDRVLFSRRQIVGFSQSDLKIAVPVKWREQLFNV